MKLFNTLILTLAIFLAVTSPLFAEETEKKPLDQVFDQTVIVPFDYHDKVFLNGQKADIFGDYKLFKKNGRVLVPIRMMGYLAAEVDRNNGYWEVGWDPLKPNDVNLTNYKLKKTVKLQVSSTTMYINTEPKILDVPPQKIEGRILLPLRSISEALDKEITWLDGLIIISNDHIDLLSPQTLEIKERIKARLSDERKEVNYEERVAPVTKYGNTLYYIKTNYYPTGIIQELLKKTADTPEVKIELPGEEKFINYQIINNELYYISTNNGKSELYIFRFADNTSRKLCTLGDWNPEDGWLGDMKYINNEFYVILHSGDLTMGGENLYKLEDGVLKEITAAKSIINFDTLGDYFYYTDFTPMFNAADNLLRVNMKTGEEEKIGEQGFSYGIVRIMGDEGSVSYSGNGALYLKDENIYTLGYKESDPKDQSAVYKISLDGVIQKKLTLPTKAFWLVDQKIYYTDLSTGYLIQVDLDGNNNKTVVEKRIVDVKFFNGNIYYTVSTGNNSDGKLGKLYKYNISGGQEIRLSDKLVSEFFVGNAGIYYKAEGYDLGLYKIDAGGESTCLADDSLYTALLTDTGIIYTLRYEPGIFTVK